MPTKTELKPTTKLERSRWRGYFENSKHGDGTSEGARSEIILRLIADVEANAISYRSALETLRKIAARQPCRAASLIAKAYLENFDAKD